MNVKATKIEVDKDNTLLITNKDGYQWKIHHLDLDLRIMHKDNEQQFLVIVPDHERELNDLNMEGLGFLAKDPS